MEAAVALREQPEIRELFEVLEGNGLKKERQEVESLVNYLEGMESQFGEAIRELKEVRGQLEQIQDRGIKATAARLLDSAEGKVQEIGGQIALVKTNLARSAKNAGRALIGRRTKELAEPGGDKGILAKVQKAFLSFGRSFAAMEKAAENAQKRMEQFCRGEGKKPSVKAELRQIKSGRSAGQKMQPAREQAR